MAIPNQASEDRGRRRDWMVSIPLHGMKVQSDSQRKLTQIAQTEGRQFKSDPPNHFVIDQAGIHDFGLFSGRRWGAIHCVVIDRNIMNASNRSVRRGSKEGHPPPMNSPARYTMPFSMNKYAHNQCMRRANANMPGPRLMWL